MTEPLTLTDAEIGAAYLTAVAKQDGLSPSQAERVITSHEQLRNRVKVLEGERAELVAALKCSLSHLRSTYDYLRGEPTIIECSNDTSNLIAKLEGAEG